MVHARPPRPPRRGTAVRTEVVDHGDENGQDSQQVHQPGEEPGGRAGQRQRKHDALGQPDVEGVGAGGVHDRASLCSAFSLGPIRMIAGNRRLKSSVILSAVDRTFRPSADPVACLPAVGRSFYCGLRPSLRMTEMTPTAKKAATQGGGKRWRRNRRVSSPGFSPNDPFPDFFGAFCSRRSPACGFTRSPPPPPTPTGRKSASTPTLTIYERDHPGSSVKEVRAVGTFDVPELGRQKRARRCRALRGSSCPTSSRASVISRDRAKGQTGRLRARRVRR